MKKFVKRFVIILLCILAIYLLYRFLFLKPQTQNNPETTETSPFSVAKVMLFSSAYGENKDTTFGQSNWILDILQYSDIAIYLENGGADLSAENTVKKLWIEDIALSKPKIGRPSLYYLDSLNFGTAHFNEHNEIQEKLEFTVLNDKNIEDNLQYNTPTFFTDCSNPITLKYVNHSVKSNYEVTSDEPVSFNGKLLEMANISLDDLKAKLDFTVHIVANNNEEFYQRLSIPIELENENNNILSGSILVENDASNLKFTKK